MEAQGSYCSHEESSIYTGKRNIACFLPYDFLGVIGVILVLRQVPYAKVIIFHTQDCNRVPYTGVGLVIKVFLFEVRNVFDQSVGARRKNGITISFSAVRGDGLGLRL